MLILSSCVVSAADTTKQLGFDEADGEITVEMAAPELSREDKKRAAEDRWRGRGRKQKREELFMIESRKK